MVGFAIIPVTSYFNDLTERMLNTKEQKKPHLFVHMHRQNPPLDKVCNKLIIFITTNTFQNW